MNIYEGYRFLNFISNKEMAGKTMQPHEYNVNLDAANIDFFNKEYQKLRAHAAQNKLNVFQLIEIGHPLKPFIKTFTLAAIPSTGKIAVPPLFVDARAGKCKVGGLPKRIDFSSYEFLNNKETNPLETSPLDEPVANIMDDFIKLQPKTATDFSIVYLRYPLKPYFGYVLDETTDLPRYLSVEEIRAKTSGAPSGTPVVGTEYSVKVTIDSVDYILGAYIAETAVLADAIHGLCANINRRSIAHGYNAEVGASNALIIYAPVGSGTAPNTGYVPSGAGSGITYTWTPAGAFGGGVAGSKQLEWAQEYHLEIYKQILSNLGVNLSDEKLVAYKKEFEVQGV